ncbi:hypothetical protein V492_02057 [Pseudogymnoascus sp. VKM F-4246]|nr:hypothetical protein V492_02057 [Pseudogymnoascus sp. VKM F-4246]
MHPSPSQSGSETSRQAARREKSLNKIPAMQRVAMALEQASSSPPSAKAEAKVPAIKKSIEVDVDDSGAGVGFAIGALPPSLPLTNGAFQSPVEDVESDIVSYFHRAAIANPATRAYTNEREIQHPDFVAPPSSHPRHSTPPASLDETNPRSEDDNGGVSTDIFADFDIPSDTDKAFLTAHLREAPKEDVTFLLNTRNAPQAKQAPSTPKSQARSILPSTPKSLLKYHQRRAIIAEYAQKVAAETIPGVPDANQLKGFLDLVQTYAIGLELGPNQALFEAKHAQEELCKAKGVKLETKMAALEMPGLELTDAIEVLASVQQTVGTLFGDSAAGQDAGVTQTTAPTKRKRVRRDKPKVESDVGGTPLSEAATNDSQPQKVKLEDRISKQQSPNAAAVVAEAAFPKVDPATPRPSKRERKIAFIQNKAKEAAAKALEVAPATVTAPPVVAEAALAEVDPAAPKMTRRERKIAFIQNKAKAAAAVEPIVAEATIITAADTKPVPVATTQVPSAEAELAEVDPPAPKMTRRERKIAFIQNKAKAAAAAKPLVAEATVITAAGTQPVPATTAQAPSAEVKEPMAAAVISPLAGDATPSDSGNKSKKVLKNEERKARRKLESATGGDGSASPKAAVAAPAEQVSAADVSTPATIKADNEAATEKSSKKRKRGAKNKATPGSGDPATTNTAPAVSQTKPATTTVNKSKTNDTKSKVATPILPSAIKPPTVAAPNAPKPVVATDDGFVDMRAPKKKKRGRKSTTATDTGSKSNTPELVKGEDIAKPEAAAPVEVKKTEPEAEAKPIATGEANDGDVGANTAGKRKRKRGPPPPKKAPDALEQQPATSIPVAVAVPEPMELCADEPARKPVVASIIPAISPVAAPIIPTSQPLSEISLPNPVSNKRRKRGNRKSIGSQDPASGGQPLEVAGQTNDISRRESSSPTTSTIKLECGLGEWKAGEAVGAMSLGANGGVIIGTSDESCEDQDAETDGEAKVSAYTMSVASEADSDDSREGSALNEFDRRATRSASREMASMDATQPSARINQPTFKYDKVRSSTPPPGDSSDETDDLESPTRPKVVQPRRNSVILPRLTQSPNKSLLQPPEPATTLTPVKKEKAITKSPYFSPEVSPKKPPRSPGGVVSCIPFPPLSSPQFGLLQEKLRHDPLRLLIGVTFLIRTYGKSSIPIYYKLMELFPTATDLANADKDVIVELTRHLGLQSVRADTYIRYAKTFLDDPPVKGKRYRVENYPTKNAHAGIKKGEILSDDDPREGAWEIGHLTKGPYAIDSWRIFCRDELRWLAKGWNGEGAKDEGFQPEWMRVLPKDKELRAFLRWCWLREGWVWDAETGEREVSGKELVQAVNDGRVVWEWKGKDGKGDWRILGKYEEDEKREEMGVKSEVE